MMPENWWLSSFDPNRRVVLWLVLFAGCLLTAEAAARGPRRLNQRREDRFLALFQDGTAVTGPQIDDWHHPAGKPQLKGQSLFDARNPVRLIRDTWREPKLTGPYIELANGDVVPGTLVRILPADATEGLSERAEVRLPFPLLRGDGQSDSIWIRPDYIARVVFHSRASGPRIGGKLIFANGRRTTVDALRWDDLSLRGLQQGGSFVARLTEFAEIHVPDSMSLDPIEAALDDVRAPCRDPDGRIERIAAANGAVFTVRREMVRMEDRDGIVHLMQPRWALHSISVPFDEIVSRSYRNPDEIPLSSLPAETLVQKNYSGFTWQWRRNQSLHGFPLSSGKVISDIGLGTHSHSVIAFRLPPSARQLTGWVGIDNDTKGGGCATCKVFRDDVRGGPAWQAAFLRGGNAPVRLDVGGLQAARRVVLVTEYGHRGRPEGADPFDIRDEVNWLSTLVRIDRDAISPSKRKLSDWIPQLAGWQTSAEDRQRFRLIPYWQREKFRWIVAMQPFVSDKVKTGDTLFALTKKFKVAPTNAWLDIRAASDDNGATQDHGQHRICAFVNGQRHGSIMNGDIQTVEAGTFNARKWTLGPFADQDVELSVVVQSGGAYPRTEGIKPNGVVWQRVLIGPIVRNLPKTGQPIMPDVPLTSLRFLEVQTPSGAQTLDRGKLSNGKPLAIRGYPYRDGFGILGGGRHKVTVYLDQGWGRFVAVVGLADGAQSVGPYEILLDDQLHWSSGSANGKSPSFGRHQTGLQVNVEIPPGHKTMTLRVQGHADNYAGLAHAGFLKE